MLRRKQLANREAIEVEKHEIEAKQATLIVGKTQASAQLKKARKKFVDEPGEPFNSKATGQPVRAAIEKICKQHGVNKGCFFGGDLQGPACRSLMRNRRAIFKDIWLYIMALPSEQKLIPDETIKEVMDAHERMLGHFDAIFSICSLKRHHVTDKQKASLKNHVELVGSVWRALDINVTPKMHLIEKHCPEIMDMLDGMGDLGEDEGERGHQTGHDDQLRCRSLNHEAKTNTILQFEAMRKDCAVIERQKPVAVSSKRKINVEKHEEKQKTNKKYKSKVERDEGRDLLLDAPLKCEKYPLLLNICKEKLKELVLE
ncbi:hypothetical protein ACA910_021095 [Epithemia clementina (nom. ined.)]